MFGNEQAASVRHFDDLPYPYGSVIVMETAGALKNEGGKPHLDDKGHLRKGEVVGLHVMRRENGLGEAYGKNRTGDWEYVEYRTDGSYITTARGSRSPAPSATSRLAATVTSSTRAGCPRSTRSSRTRLFSAIFAEIMASILRGGKLLLDTKRREMRSVSPPPSDDSRRFDSGRRRGSRGRSPRCWPESRC